MERTCTLTGPSPQPRLHHQARVDLDVQLSLGEGLTSCLGTVVLRISLCKHPVETLWAAPGQMAALGAPSLLTDHVGGAAA